MGAAMLRHALAAEGPALRAIPVVSAGVSARRGEAMTDYSAAALKKVGIPAGDHASQPVTQELLDRALLVLCMTEAHRASIRAIARPVPRHLLLFRELVRPPTENPEVEDPYGGPFQAYESSRDEMVEAIPAIVQFLKTLKN
jgi:protein-tyrosine-phosphatase